MKTILLALGAASLLTLPAAAQLATTANHATTATTSSSLTADEQLFTKLIGQVGTAIEQHDMTALGQYMAPEYVHYNPNNGSSNRPEELAYIGTWSNTTVKTITPVKVNHYGNTVITVATTVFSGEEGGKAFKSTIQMMIAWVLRDGRWQMAVMQSKLMPA